MRTSTLLIGALAVAIPASVRAEPAPPPTRPPAVGASRVLVADDDPELARAIERSLAPWRLVVVVDREIPDEAQAYARAELADARFIVWRDRGELVVFDRELGTTERRPGRAGAFDSVSAAAAALTVKTMMRLPPEPGTGDATSGIITSGPETPPAAPSDDDDPELRLQAGIAGRIARGSQTDLAGRFALGVFVRPSPALGWRIGVAAELGTRSTVEGAGFRGDWTDGAALGLLTWTYDAAAVELEPMIGVGAARVAFDGAEMQTTRRERTTIGVLRAGVTARRTFGMWSVGAYIAADANLGTPTYTRINNGGNQTTIFAVPSFAAVVGMLAAIDFGR